MEIFDGAGVNQNEVEKFRNFFLELFRPRANFGAKEKVELQTFVLDGHPIVYSGGHYATQGQSCPLKKKHFFRGDELSVLTTIGHHSKLFLLVFLLVFNILKSGVLSHCKHVVKLVGELITVFNLFSADS